MTFATSGSTSGSICLSRSWKRRRPVDLSRRKFLQYRRAPFAFLPAGIPLRSFFSFLPDEKSAAPAALQLHPEYRLKRESKRSYAKCRRASDDFVTEKYQDQIEAILRAWSAELLEAPQRIDAIRRVMSGSFAGSFFQPSQEMTLYHWASIKTWKTQYSTEMLLSADVFLTELRSYFGNFTHLQVAEFQIISIRAEPATGQSLPLDITVRFEFVGTGSGFHREQRIGHWEMAWERLASAKCAFKTGGFARRNAVAHWFLRFRTSLPARSVPILPMLLNWCRARTTGVPFSTEPAASISYGHNGVSVGDATGDGLDDLISANLRGYRIGFFGIAAMARLKTSRTPRASAFWRIRRARYSPTSITMDTRI